MHLRKLFRVIKEIHLQINSCQHKAFYSEIYVVYIKLLQRCISVTNFEHWGATEFEIALEKYMRRSKMYLRNLKDIFHFKKNTFSTHRNIG